VDHVEIDTIELEFGEAPIEGSPDRIWTEVFVPNLGVTNKSPHGTSRAAMGTDRLFVFVHFGSNKVMVAGGDGAFDDRLASPRPASGTY